MKTNWGDPREMVSPSQRLVHKVLKFSNNKIGVLKSNNKLQRSSKARFNKEVKHIGSL